MANLGSFYILDIVYAWSTSNLFALPVSSHELGKSFLPTKKGHFRDNDHKINHLKISEENLIALGGVLLKMNMTEEKAL